MAAGSTSALGPPIQIAYAVPDARQAAQRWASETGAGPFLVRSTTGLTNVSYRGQPGSFDHTSAYGQWGNVMLELVEDHQDERTPIREMFGTTQSGLHHLAFAVESLVEASHQLEASGCERVMSATTPNGTEFRFFDARESHGHMFELYAKSSRLADFYESIRLASVGWDGMNAFVD